MRIRRILPLLTVTALLAVLLLSLTGCGILDLESGLLFRATIDNKGAYVTGHESSLLEDELMIPPTYRDRPVVGIDESALAAIPCTSVTIPASVNYIGSLAFYSAHIFGLEEIRFAETEGWYVLETGEEIPPSLLADPAAAAGLFTTGVMVDYTAVRTAD